MIRRRRSSKTLRRCSRVLYGYAGQILYVDLTDGSHRVVQTPEGMARQFIGSRGFGAKLLWDELDPEVQPFD
ncbi:MAG: aldehyde ferredoxin oxidoreductase N-terminal domain-containing protein, partial [Bacillota bacterium]